MIAPRGYARGEHPRLGLIGVAYDGSAEADLALAEGERMAQGVDAELRLIGVLSDLGPLGAQAFDVEGVRTSMRRELEQALEKGVASVGKETTAASVLKEGDPATVLADQGVELDLIVIGSRGYGPVRNALLGAVSAQLVRTAPCPVLVTPRGSAAADGA
jgi:nucleotide-binding universal stress UspA family protein